MLTIAAMNPLYIHIIFAVIIGYVLGSIPFALVIGKVFYHTDVRNFGSGNLGGSNAGRVLGKKAGIATIILDIAKVIVAVAIVSTFDQQASIWAGLAAAFGHCFPLFAGFRGGKAVATMFGFLLSCSIFTFHDPWILLIPLIVFIIVLILFKMVSLASICAALSSTIYILFISNYTSVQVASVLLTVLVIIRHSSNIQRIMNGNENKVTWLLNDSKKKHILRKKKDEENQTK